MSSVPSAWHGLLSRRDLLQVGALGIASTFLPGKAVAAKSSVRAKSVIVLWMAGGVTHIDSFDPKPDAPAEIRGTLSSIQTTLPGVRFGEVMPHLARIADKLAVLRGFSSGNDDHFLSQAMALSGRMVTPAQITENSHGIMLDAGSDQAFLTLGRAPFPTRDKSTQVTLGSGKDRAFLCFDDPAADLKAEMGIPRAALIVTTDQNTLTLYDRQGQPAFSKP